MQVAPEHAEEVLSAAQGSVVIGEITEEDHEIFEYGGRRIAEIPNRPSKETLDSLG